jgi:hypothetical protein
VNDRIIDCVDECKESGKIEEGIKEESERARGREEGVRNRWPEGKA